MDPVLTDIDLVSLEYVCLNMRPIDAVEIYGVRDHDSPIRLAWEAYHMIRNRGRGRIAWHNGRPAAVIALTEDRPGVWQIWMFGTGDFKAVAYACMRWARETVADLIENHGGKRLHCESHEAHTEAHRFLRALGAIAEGPPMRHFGKDGASYQRFVWIAGENDHRLRSDHHVRRQRGRLHGAAQAGGQDGDRQHVQERPHVPKLALVAK
ncbi:MAG: hypothetical protein AB1781_11185 [Pseudomonadota bacterium]